MVLTRGSYDIFRISLRARCPSIFSKSWDTVLKKPVQSSIFVRLVQRIFKSDYITRYLHTWVVRLCIILTVGESPRV